MKNFIKFILLFGIIISSACGDYEEINTDPTSPSEVSLELMLPGTLSQTWFNQGTNPARVAGIIMQQFRGFDAQQVAYTDYVLPDVTFDNYWQLGLYSGSLRSANLIINTAEAENAPHYAGIARILMAAGYGDAASYFGDIPFSDALKGSDNLKPGYDTQEEVYAGVQSLLDQAISDLSQAAGDKAPTVDDIVFNGDASAWIATAQALKARYLMQTINRNSGNASTILSLVQNDAFQSIDTEPAFTWGTAQTDNNPLAKFGFERPNTLIIDSRFADILDATADPRKDKFMFFNGSDYLYWDPSVVLTWAEDNSRIPLISIEEVKLMEAELLLASGDEDGAKAAMSAAIAANMDKNGVDGTDYIAEAEARFDAADDKLSILMDEAYVCYYGQAFNITWANYRRTGYPSLTPSTNGNNGLNPGGAIPRRYIYPLSEYQTNSDNLDAAISNQGGALMNNDLWSFQ